MFAKHYSRAGVFAWSPRESNEQGLIVGDYAQQFSAFSANSTTVENPSIDFIPLQALYDLPRPAFRRERAVNAEFKFNDLCWTMGSASAARPFGLVVGGCENGVVAVFDATKLIKESRLEVLSQRKDHVGHVLSVDVSHDKRWAMSGGGSGQVLLWDLSNLSTPFSPGSPTYPDQVKSVKWSGRMEQIAASLSSHRCSLWDLRRNGTPIIDIGEVGGGCDWAEVCWSPIEETALITASQADTVPVLYKWDLRYPTAPVRDLRVHSKGITAIDWHTADARLLLSASHDGTMLISNPETGETLGRVGVMRDWVRRVRWSPGKTDLVAIQYFQSAVQISSLQSMGVCEEVSETLFDCSSSNSEPDVERGRVSVYHPARSDRSSSLKKSEDERGRRVQWDEDMMQELEVIRIEKTKRHDIRMQRLQRSTAARLRRLRNEDCFAGQSLPDPYSQASFPVYTLTPIVTHTARSVQEDNTPLQNELDLPPPKFFRRFAYE